MNSIPFIILHHQVITIPQQAATNNMDEYNDDDALEHLLDKAFVTDVATADLQHLVGILQARLTVSCCM